MAEQRLSKIAKDCGVGVNTVTEFLKKKGYQGDVSPNAKIPEDIYAIIVKEYSADQRVRKESERISREKSTLDKRTISIDENQGEELVPHSPEAATPEKAPVVPAAPVAPAPVAKASPAKPAEENTVELPPRQEPRILGKIDVSALTGKRPAPEKKEPEMRQPEAPQKEEKPVQAVAPEPARPVVEVVPPAPEPVPEPVEPAHKAEPEAPEPPKAVEAVEPDSSDFRLGAPAVQGPKVIGKIDLERKPPARKKAPEPEPEAAKPAPSPAPEPAPTVETTAPEPPKAVEPVEPVEKTPAEEVPYRSNTQKLSGPTVIGKIDLSSLEKKKPQPIASSDKDKQTKKKRKRIGQGTGPGGGPTPPGQSSGQGNRPQGQRGPGTQAPGGPRQGQGGQAAKGKKVLPKLVKPEITDEDVQKQIKDTLARLTSKTKSKGAKFRRQKRDDVRQRAIEAEERSEADRSILKIAEFVTVNELASMMNVPVIQVISTCMSLGLFVSINQRLDAETISIVSEEFGFQVQFINVVEDEETTDEPDAPEDLRSRPPIVTVMGHVDHGKTSLLDYIRHANVIAGEAGGITQHIGAYSVTRNDGRVITFLDTPGHEAFTAMRARGAQVTDMAIIVVAADDRVMPQTVEAINHASAAGVPIVFAINKVDKPNSNPEKIKEELATMNYLVEDWGGKYQSQEISAKYGTNVEELLEKVLLEADILDLKANPSRLAYGTVIESSLDKGRGYVATVLVQNGTLKPGDIVLAGSHTGHVKALQNERGQRIKSAGPATPVLVLGLDGAPQAGDKFQVMATEREAREIANRRTQLLREQGLRTQKHLTLEEIGRRIALGNFQEINVIVKGDVDGSVEALSDSLLKLSTPSIQVNIIHKAVGQISESDINLAAASNAIIIGFQVRPSVNARKLAEKEQIDIRLYSVIYSAIEEMKDAMEGMLSPEIKEEIVCTAEILEVFRITRVGNVAGCIVRDGKFTRNTKIRLIREGIVVFQGELSSLKRHKEDVREVATGFECGMSIHNFNDIRVGDIIEGYTQVEVKRKL